MDSILQFLKKIIVILFVLVIATLILTDYNEEYSERARAEGYKAGYEAGYKAGLAELKEMPKPASGTILSGKEYNGSEITVKASTDCDYVVSLKNVIGKEYVSFYVRAGDTVTVGVPEEYLYVYFASGTEWYGYGKGFMFGINTVYSKDDECHDFAEYTWDYKLYPVSNGNFSETPSNEDEFF